MARTKEIVSDTATMTSRDLRKRGGRGPAALTLGLWRAKRMWRLLLALAAGMTAAVMLVCLVPLVMEATTVAGLQSVFERNAGTNMVFSRSMNTDTIDQQLVTKTHDQLISYLRTNYAGIPYHLSIEYTGTIPLAVITARSSAGTNGMILTAVAPRDMTSLYDLVSGRYPQSSGSQLEAVISSLTASKLHLKLGDSLTVPVLSGSTSSPLTLRIVGFAHRVTAATDQPNLEPFIEKAPPGKGNQQPFLQFAAVVSLPAVEASSAQWSAFQMFAPYGGPPPQMVTGNGPPIWSATQDAALDFSHMDWQTANRLLSNPFQDGGQAAYPVAIGPYGAVMGGPSDASVSVSGQLAYAVHSFQQRLIWSQVAVYILLADLLGLVLLFLGLMLSALVERQEALIALLRSRGASRGQIMRALSLQSGMIGVLAILVGPLLAVPLARWLAERLLGAQTPDIGDALGGNPVQAALGTWIVALVAGLLFTGVLVWSSRRAAKRTLVALRTEEARGTRRPLWQRMYLDVVAAVLAIAGYSVYIIATRAAATTNTFQSNNVETALSPLALVAPIFLMVAAALLFVRILPWLLRLAERIAARGKGASAVLAFSQLARSSAQARRTILLLALVLCFGIFTLGATATLGRYVRESADFAVGADFSGGIVHTSGSGVEALQTEATPFGSIPGVTSVSVGYRDSLTVLAQDQQPVDFNVPQAYPLLAVDPTTYAKTVIWPAQNRQSLTSALALLAAHATDATSRDTVPVVLDASAAQTLGVHEGSTFTLIPNGYGSNRMHFEVVGIVDYLPAAFHDQPTLGGGILADYHSFYAVYEHDMGSDSTSAIVPNFVLMRTRDDAATLARVRKAIDQGPTQLTETVGQSTFGPITMSAIDRRAFLASVQADPFYVALTSTITTGAAIALLLALVGVITGAWLGVARRRQGLAILRALGLPAGQVRRVVIWEQGFVLALAVGLGIGLGAFLSAVTLKALPLLVLSSSIGGPIEAGGMPPLTVWPWPLLAGALAGVIVICALVVAIAARVAARPAVESALRLASE